MRSSDIPSSKSGATYIHISCIIWPLSGTKWKVPVSCSVCVDSLWQQSPQLHACVTIDGAAYANNAKKSKYKKSQN